MEDSKVFEKALNISQTNPYSNSSEFDDANSSCHLDWIAELELYKKNLDPCIKAKIQKSINKIRNRKKH